MTLARINSAFSAFGAMLRTALTGEPLRFISYGAVITVVVVTHLAFALGITQAQPPSFDVVSGAVASAVVVVTELARRYAWSPNSVQAAIAVAVEDATKAVSNP